MIRSILKSPSTEQLVSRIGKFNSRLYTNGKNAFDQVKNDQKVSKVAENTLQTPLLTFSDKVKPWSPLLSLSASVLALGTLVYTAKKDIQADIKDVRNELKRANNKFDNANTELNKRIDNSNIELGKKIDNVSIELNKRIDNSNIELGKKIDNVSTELNKRIDNSNIELGKKIDLVNSNLTKRIDGQSQRIDTLIQRIYGLEGNASFNSSREILKPHSEGIIPNVSDQQTVIDKSASAVPTRQSKNYLLNKLDEYDAEILLNIIKEKRQDGK